MDNKHIIGKLILKNSEIRVLNKKSNNYIFCDNTFGDVLLENSVINFNGTNSAIFIVGGNLESLKIKATLNTDTFIYIGRNSSFHERANCHIVASEGSSIVIGDDCLLSRGVWIRTGDAHPIYSTDSHKRVNYSKNVIIGDHVWIGQGTTLLKGTKIGSGAIVGANSLCSNNFYSSNTSFGGVPARTISKEGAVFFEKTDINAASKEKLLSLDTYKPDSFIYNADDKKCIFQEIDIFLINNKDPLKRIEFFKNISKDKNRFAYKDKKN